MAEGDARRMILQRLDPKGDDSSLVAGKIEATPGIDVLDHSSASSLLVHGEPAAIDAVVKGIPGWSAFPVSTFDRPDTRPRVLKPPE